MLPGKKHIGRPRAVGPAEAISVAQLFDVKRGWLRVKQIPRFAERTLLGIEVAPGARGRAG